MYEFDNLVSTLIKFGALDKSCSMKVSEEIGISELQIKQIAYVNIIGSKEYITYGDFANILGITRPSVTSIANKLISAGIVDKHQCNNDGRVYYLGLTHKGKEVYKSHHLVAKKTAKVIIDRLSEEEVKVFLKLLNKIID